MKATPDPAQLGRRRTLEVAGLVSRGLGMIGTLLFLAGALGPMSRHLPTLLRTTCWLGVAMMAVAGVLGVLNYRRPDHRWYEARSVLQIGLDTATVTGIVIWSQGYNQQTAWPMLIMPIVIGALRHRLAGALAVWAVTSAAFATAMASAPHPAVRNGEVVTAVLLGVIVAILCGTQGDAFARQVKELEEARRALHHQARHDPLTGLPNRAEVEESAAGHDGRALAVLLLDLNGFKQVNDTLGHAAGDRLLQEVGRRLTTGLRDGDLAGRIGGDEFIVLLPGADPGMAADLAARLRAEIRRPFDLDGTRATVGASIGIACRAAGEPTRLDELTRDADAAMYREKALSRG